MKISHRLVGLAAFSAVGLVCVAGVSYYAVTSIQSDLRGLTLQATPLQNKTYELQERTERVLGALLRLTLAHGRDDVDRTTATLAAEMAAIDKLRAEMAALDQGAAGGDLAEFRSAQAEITGSVDQRLADDQAYRSETESARAALQKAAEAIAITRASVAQIGVEAGKTADRAQDASRELAAEIKLVLSAQARLKEIAILVNETDGVTSRFRLTPLKEKLKATVDGIMHLQAEGGATDVLKDARAVVTNLSDAFGRDDTGLFALRAAVLASRPDADAAYQKVRKTILAALEEQDQKLGVLNDAAEEKAFKQRQALEAALRVRNEPGGVVATSEEVALDIREVVGALRLLMLAGNAAEAQAAQDELTRLDGRLKSSMAGMRAGLLRMGHPQLVPNVDSAIGSMASVSASVAKVGAAKTRLLASEARMNEALARLKTVAARQSSAGAEQVKSIAERQAEVTAAVDRRVTSSLVFIVAIAGVIIAVSAALSAVTVRIVTRRLNQAVRVAEQVSRGHLDPPDAVTQDDETGRLLGALSSMVATLTGIVGDIRGAAQEITTGSGEISRGNLDLSQRTEAQAGNLQQTSSAVEELNDKIRHNAEAALAATNLAANASVVAERGGQLVGEVVATMASIQSSSKEIAEIIGVIDGIAFQTNLLALNAAVEAARAGEHGRGFAVVASEVRALAQKSADAAQRIKSIIVASVEKIDSGSALVHSTGRTMADIVSQVNQVNALIAEIASASDAQAGSVAQVREAMGTLDEMTQRNAALAEQSTAAAESLNDQARSLSQAIAVFRLGADRVAADGAGHGMPAGVSALRA